MQFKAFSFREKEAGANIFSTNEQKLVNDIVFYLKVISLHALDRPFAGY